MVHHAKNATNRVGTVGSTGALFALDLEDLAAPPRANPYERCELLRGFDRINQLLDDRALKGEHPLGEDCRARHDSAANSLYCPRARILDRPESVFDRRAVEGLRRHLRLPGRDDRRESGSYRLTAANHGNVPLQATLEGIDPDELLSFQFDPPTLLVVPGQSAYGQLMVQARSTFYDGPPQPHAFNVQLGAEGLAPVTVDATFLQEAVPRPVARKFPLIPVLLGLFDRPTWYSAG